MTDWRTPRPIHQDPRLECVTRLVRHYRNLWLEADFEGDAENAKRFEQQYRHYQQLDKSGVYYEPMF